ncbi:hypothetical protein ACIBP6_29235 [Nonomuraea terrae]|uniref:VMAP-C domain-containing protein n=1 Tax=Nonomuraea terrae TaxID=2530383 RepID=UPI00379AC990
MPVVGAVADLLLRMGIDPEDLLATVNADLPLGLNVPYAKSNRALLIHVVQRTLAADDGARVLLKSVHYLVGADTPELEHLRRLLGPAKAVMEEGAEGAIIELLRSCEVAELRTLYHVATEGKGRDFPPQLATAWQIFDFLLDSNTRPGALPPSLTFVILVYRQLVHQEPGQDPRVARGLHRWIEGQRAQLHRTGDDEAAHKLEQLLNGSPPFKNRADLPVCLVIEIRPLHVPDDERDLHQVDHWLQTDQTGWNPVHGEEAEVPFDELPDYVAELIERTETAWVSTWGGPMLLEFLLPEDLLGLAVEHWPRQTGGYLPSRPLGADYEVVLRSDDRLRPKSKHRRWHRRWHHLLRGEGLAHLVPLDSVAPEATHAELMRQEQLAACVLSAPPIHPKGRAELEAAIDAGLPAVLWCRDMGRNADFRVAAAHDLHPHALKKLPTRIKELRGEVDTCCHAALLWDDPDRPMPSASRLRSPA